MRPSYFEWQRRDKLMNSHWRKRFRYHSLPCTYKPRISLCSRRIPRSLLESQVWRGCHTECKVFTFFKRLPMQTLPANDSDFDIASTKYPFLSLVTLVGSFLREIIMWYQMQWSPPEFDLPSKSMTPAIHPSAKRKLIISIMEAFLRCAKKYWDLNAWEHKSC